jgi:predicted ABC-type ATPase
VPITKIITRYSKSISNCTIISKLVDRLYVYDNSIDFSQAKLLFRTTNGEFSKKYTDINDWAKPIFKSIK